MDDKGPSSLESFLQQGDTPGPRAEQLGKTFKRRSTNINVQKSIQILDEAVAPSVNRPTRTPRGFRNSSYTPVRWDSKFAADASEMFMFTPAKRRTTTHSPAFGDVSAQTFSPNVNITSRQLADEMTIGVDMTEDITGSRISFMTDEDPGKAASSGLFSSFKEAHLQNAAPHQAMDLLSDFESSCAEQVNELKKLSKCVTRSKLKFRRAMTTFDVLQHEKNTWKLLHSLYKDRLETEAKDTLLDEQMDGDDGSEKLVVWSLSEQNIANRLFEKDVLVRQGQLVIDWLETCAYENLDNYYNQAKFFVDQPVSWENTLHHLQKKKQGLRSASDRLITEMDPDAPHRLKKSLDDLDQEDDRFFIQNLFSYLRAGQLEKAQELCQACGQPWRAAALEGWRLFHDPNYYARTLSAEVATVEGNPYRDVWKSVCWRMTKEPEFDHHERAVYAALSGNLQALLPVCTSWMDYVWAYFRVMVDIKVEQEIRLHRHTNRSQDALPTEYLDKLHEPHEIFAEIAASLDETIRLQSENWYHIIQKFVILGDVSALIETMYSWLQKDRDSLPGHLIRMMAHIILFLRTIGHACKEELCEAILEAYVEDLIKNKHKHLIAHYVSTLSMSAQVQWYATFLEDIEMPEERQQCLAWAEEEGLDVALITKTVVERIRSRETMSVFPDNSLAPDLTITEEDRAKIDAVDWLVFDPSHRPEAIKQANAIMRSFIVVKKHAAARQVFEKLPSDTIDIIYRLWHLKTGSTELPASDNNAIREYMCMKAYLDAVESFNDWFSLYHQGQPVKPSGTEGTTFTDRVALEHKMKQYRQEYDRWMHNLRIQTKTTRDRIYNVLLFADGGWLVDAYEDPERDTSRQHQMSQLRKLHLPGLCFNLNNVLHASGMFVEALQIADVVASEQHQLYKEFDKESMKHLLGQISRSSHSLLDENKDPLGYEVV